MNMEVGNRPELTKQDQTHEYVTGAFLLAASEMIRLLDAGLIAGDKPAAAAGQPTAAPVVPVTPKDVARVTKSGKSVAKVEGVTFLHMENNAPVYAIASGPARPNP